MVLKILPKPQQWLKAKHLCVYIYIVHMQYHYLTFPVLPKYIFIILYVCVLYCCVVFKQAFLLQQPLHGVELEDV